MTLVQPMRGPDIYPPNMYLLALTWFTRKVSEKTGNMYLRASFRIIAGPLDGGQLYASLPIMEKLGAIRRWQIYAQAVGYKEPLQLSDDAAVMHAFRGRGFKAHVIEEKGNDGRSRNDLGYLAFRREYTPDDVAAIDRWWGRWIASDGPNQPAGWHPGEAEYDAGPIDPYLERGA